MTAKVATSERLPPSFLRCRSCRPAELVRFSALCCRPCRAVSPSWSLCAPPALCCFTLVEFVRSPALCLVRTAFAMRGYLERRSPLFGALKALKTLRVLKNHRFSNTPNISNTSNTPKIHPLAARMMDFPHK